MSRADPSDVLRRHGWLSRTDAEFRDAVLAHGRILRRSAGEAVYRVGDERGGFFGICVGSVAIGSILGHVEAPIVHIGQPGMWFGAGPVLTGMDRVLDAVARSDVTLLHLTRTAAMAMTLERPEWWRWIGAMVNDNVVLALVAVTDLQIRDNKLRCAAVLLRLCDARLADPPAPVEAPVTQDEIAAMINLSRNSAGAVLRELEQEGLIALGYRSVALREPAALRALVDAADAFAEPLAAQG